MYPINLFLLTSVFVYIAFRSGEFCHQLMLDGFEQRSEYIQMKVVFFKLCFYLQLECFPNKYPTLLNTPIAVIGSQVFREVRLKYNIYL